MLLSGSDLASYIKQRHYQQVRGLKIRPKLAVIHASSDPATGSYIKTKQAYADDIGVAFEVHRPHPATAAIVKLVHDLNQDQSTHGLIVQLPLPDVVATDQVAASIDPAKDVDGLGAQSNFDPATPTGILWLLAAHQIEVRGQTVAVIGQGRLVGKPLSSMLENSGAKVVRCDITTRDLPSKTIMADIIVTATGTPRLLRTNMVKSGAVVIDVSADADPSLLERDDIRITPPRGGVGPMTVAALFDNLLRAATN